ncbi:MAG: hypothetical protein V1750_08025 [Acidobacteriota bacterium]
MLGILLCGLLASTQPESLRLTLLTTEGGFNPAEERFELEGDGQVSYRVWELALGPAATESWSIARDRLDEIRRIVDPSRLQEMPDLLNAGEGASSAFMVRLEVVLGDRGRTMVAYPFGAPPLPPAFAEVVTAIRRLLTADGSFPRSPSAMKRAQRFSGRLPSPPLPPE